MTYRSKTSTYTPRDTRETIGKYTIVAGKLSRDDSRNAYALTDVNGRQAPVASFWSFSEGVRWAKARTEGDDAKGA